MLSDPPVLLSRRDHPGKSRPGQLRTGYALDKRPPCLYRHNPHVQEHIHSHIFYNSTTPDCTRKFRSFWGPLTACVWKTDYPLRKIPSPGLSLRSTWPVNTAKSFLRSMRRILSFTGRPVPASSVFWTAASSQTTRAASCANPGHLPVFQLHTANYARCLTHMFFLILPVYAAESRNSWPREETLSTLRPISQNQCVKLFQWLSSNILPIPPALPPVSGG